MEPHRPPEALRPILSLIPSPEHGRRRADPPPAAPLRGPASSDPLPTSHGHPKVALEPLSIFPHFPLAAGDSPRRKSQRRRPSVLFSSARDPKLKEPKLPVVKLQNVLKLQNSEL